MEKVIKDGKVAVIVSPDFGGGWSTWADEDQKLTALFDRRFVEAVENKASVDIRELCEEVFGEGTNFYPSGWESTVIEWVPEGEHFIIDEYDGFERLNLVHSVAIQA